jgi:hypothetical protein
VEAPAIRGVTLDTARLRSGHSVSNLRGRRREDHVPQGGRAGPLGELPQRAARFWVPRYLKKKGGRSRGDSRGYAGQPDTAGTSAHRRLEFRGCLDCRRRLRPTVNQRHPHGSEPRPARKVQPGQEGPPRSEIGGRRPPECDVCRARRMTDLEFGRKAVSQRLLDPAPNFARHRFEITGSILGSSRNPLSRGLRSVPKSAEATPPDSHSHLEDVTFPRHHLIKNRVDEKPKEKSRDQPRHYHNRKGPLGIRPDAVRECRR